MAPVFASVQIYTEPVTKLCHQMSCIYCSVKFTARESYRRTRCVCNSCAPVSLSLINQFIHVFIFHKYILIYLIKRIEWICWGENNIMCRIQGPFWSQRQKSLSNNIQSLFQNMFSTENLNLKKISLFINDTLFMAPSFILCQVSGFIFISEPDNEIMGSPPLSHCELLGVRFVEICE